MRVEPDRQDHYRSETPACHRCGIPLLDETQFCPYCERWLDDGGEAPRRLTDPIPHVVHRATRVSERALLTAGFVLFAAVAVACLVVALVAA